MSGKIAHLDQVLLLPDADALVFNSLAAGGPQANEALAKNTYKFGILQRSEGSY